MTALPVTHYFIISVDKNPHPDSKIAFDAIQEAFETLSSPMKRASYNTEQRKRTGRSSMKRTIRFLSGEIYNLRSRMQLFWVRIFRRGELRVEYKELIGDKVAAMVAAIAHTAEHIVLLPSIVDRVRLVSEISYDSRHWLVAAAFLAAFI